MAWTISLTTETGEEKAAVIDRDNLLPQLLQTPDDPDSTVLKYIDRYGNTIFNRLQMPPFLREWSTIRRNAQHVESRQLLDSIEALGRRCAREVHLYLKFIGD